MSTRFLTRPFSTDFPKTADVVIIGGGPAGSATLWALHRADPTLQLVLIEQAERLGSGSSTASLENFRTCWPAPCLAAQMARSIDIYLHADEYLGEGASQALAVKKQGYLFCGFTDVHAASLKKDVAHLHQHGLAHVEFLDTDAVNTRFPWLAGRVTSAKYDPLAGWLDSNALIYRYAQNAQNATILLGLDSAIVVKQGKVVGVKTAEGQIACPNVVIAAGANAIQIGRTAGVELPIIVRPRQSFTTGWRHAEFPPDAPMLIGSAPYPHVRPEASTGAIFGWEYHWNNKNLTDLSVNGLHDALIDPVYPLSQLKDPRFPSMVLLMLTRQFGYSVGQGFADQHYLHGLHHNIGYYVYRDASMAYHEAANGTRHAYESERAIIDAVPTVAGLFVSVAHVGHGIMSSAAAGEIMAAKVLQLPLAHPRFADFGWDMPWVEFDENAL